MNYIEVSASPEQIVISTQFAEKCYEARKEIYQRRGQANKETIVRQIAAGKVFEFAVFNYLRSYFPKESVGVKSPCVKITKFPSFDADIKIRLNSEPSKEISINIKTQEEYSVKKYGVSWVFQRSDKIFDNKKKEVLALGILTKNGGKLVSLDFVEKFIPFLGDMKLESLNTNKHSIYYKNSPEFNINKKNLDFLLGKV